MGIARINGYHLKFIPERPLGNARMFIRSREFLALELISDTGARGWGEVFSSPWGAAALIRNSFGRMVLGQPAAHYGRLYEQMLGGLGYDRRGAAMMAVSALDMALHDVAAREQGVSVAAMLGGALHARLPAYASGPFIREGEAPYAHFIDETLGLIKQGFRLIKPRVGVNPRADGAMITALREAVGPDIGLMVDINQGYSARAAIDSAKRMEAGGLLWIEEPVLPEDIGGYRTVSEAVNVAIAGGEALGSIASFRDFLEARALSLLQPDMTVCGGYSGYRRIAALASAYDLPVMPHVFGTIINFYAAMQMASLQATIKGGGPMPYPFVEYDATRNPLLEFFGCPIEADGKVSIPQGPGTGLELKPEMLKPWTVDTWSMDVK